MLTLCRRAYTPSSLPRVGCWKVPYSQFVVELLYGMVQLGYVWGSTPPRRGSTAPWPCALCCVTHIVCSIANYQGWCLPYLVFLARHVPRPLIVMGYHYIRPGEVEQPGRRLCLPQVDTGYLRGAMAQRFR